MTTAYTVSFLELIDAVFDDVSFGVASGHHLHNVKEFIGCPISLAFTSSRRLHHVPWLGYLPG
jgi:hypothetical protein